MKKAVIVTVGVLVTSMLLLRYADFRLRSEAYLRSASLEALWCMIGSYADDHEAPPGSLDELIRNEEISKESMKIFKGNLLYRDLGEGHYELREASKRMVSLFRRDRLLASETLRPHWESGKGELAP